MYKQMSFSLFNLWSQRVNPMEVAQWWIGTMRRAVEWAGDKHSQTRSNLLG